MRRDGLTIATVAKQWIDCQDYRRCTISFYPGSKKRVISLEHTSIASKTGSLFHFDHTFRLHGQGD